MSDKIEPALSAEEWADNGHVQRPGSDLSIEPWIDKSGRLSLYILDAGNVCDGDESLPTDAGHELNLEERHALAALALYGMPFGFTRDDVASLRELIGFGEDKTEGRYVEEWMAAAELARLHSLAARIEALLPPEKP